MTQVGLKISEGDTNSLFRSSLPFGFILIGAVHIVQALAPLASMAGYSVILIDSRRAFNTNERFFLG